MSCHKNDDDIEVMVACYIEYDVLEMKLSCDKGTLS